MSDNNVAARLKLFLEYKGLSNSQFADLCGIPRPTLSQLFSGRNKKISDLLIGQIHGTFPELSVVWLLFGEGDMLEKNDAASATAAILDAPDGLIAAEFEDPAPYGSSGDKYSTLGGLESSSYTTNSSTNQRDTTPYKVRDLERKIDNLKKNPRKVVQITVYYDDNTFETFAPA